MGRGPEIALKREISLAVVVPFYNEGGSVVRSVKALLAAIHLFPVPGCLIAVDDGSTDQTWSELAAMPSPRDGEKIFVRLRHSRNQGYGAALNTGSMEALRRGFSHVLFADADLTNSPTDFPRFIAELLRGFDVVKATRYARGGGVDGVPFYRWAISRLGNLFASALLQNGLTDPTNGFRACSTALRARLDLREKGFSSILEEMAALRSQSCRYAEIPVRLGARKRDQRKSSFSYRLSTFWLYGKHPLKAWAARLSSCTP